MAITTDTLKFFTAERMTDNSDGGGQMSSTEIVSGASNQIFDDISDVDRAAGDLSLRKVYAAVTSADTDKYLDAGTVILKPPADPNVSVMQFSTGDYYDERADWIGLLESSVSRGRRYAGWLYGTHIAGQRALLIWMRPGNDEPPAAGARLNITALASGVETHTEFVWVTKITVSSRTITDSSGQYAIDEITCDLAYPLQNAYTGIDPSRVDPATTAVSGLIYEVRYNPDLVTLAGIKPLALAADTGDYSVKVDGGLYQALIPTGLQETALADTNPGGDSGLLIAGSASADWPISRTTTLNLVKPDGTLFLGRACYPGTVSITVSGATITDENGALNLSSGTTVGAINYATGICTFNSSCPNYGTASKTFSYVSAIQDLRVSDTAAIIVTAENRGYVYIITLAPIPAPSGLRISYQVNKVWYTLYEKGSGLLEGVDSSYGSGHIDFGSGTVVMTTGALPDIDSMILFSWTTPVTYIQRGGNTVAPAKVRGTLAKTQIVPGSVSIEWSTLTLAEPVTPDGTLEGTGGTGSVDYATGQWEVTPDALPAIGTEFTISYDYTENADIYSEDFASPTIEIDGSIILSLAQANIEPRSIKVTFPLKATFTGSYYPHSSFNYFLGPQLVDSIYNVSANDDGAGALTSSSGTVDYVNGEIVLQTDRDIGAKLGRWGAPVSQGTIEIGENLTVNLKTSPVIYDLVTIPAAFLPDSTVTVKYRLDGSTPSTSETYTLDQVQLDLTMGYAETIVQGSVAFLIGSSYYVNTAGQIYRDPSLETGAGTLAGSLDPTTGIVRLENWTAGTNAPALRALVTTVGDSPVDACIFRTPVANVRPGSLQLRATTTTGDVISEVVPQSGILETAEVSATVNYPDGIVSARFGLWRTVSTLDPEDLLEPWYHAEAIVSIGGVDKIWQPIPVMSESIIYNAVAQSILPPDRDMLGIDASRLPPDGQALIFQQGKLALIHHTDSFVEAALSPTEVLDCERVRLYRVVIEDGDGQRLPPSFYTVNRELGTVTMAADLDLTGYTGSYTVYHTVADLARVTAVDISGTLTLNKAVSHDYPADDSYASGVLYVGTLQARYSGMFAQSTWTSVWSDELIGSEPLAQYNDTLYPVIISNLGAYKDRILIKFTSSTAFQCFGENLGLIGTGDVTVNFAPTNSLTGQPYFTLDYRGWGAGWATGNCLRFNLIGANVPVDLIRAVQPSDPTGLDDSVELCFIGNVDAS